MPTLPPMIPYLTVSNGAGAIEFYKKAFGAVVQGTVEQELHDTPGTDEGYECLPHNQRWSLHVVG